MRTLLTAAILMACLVSPSSAQNISLKVGTLYYPEGSDIFQTGRIEASFAFPLSKKFEVSLTTGYYRHEMQPYIQNYFYGGINGLPYSAYQYDRIAYTIHDIPIVAGIKYLFGAKPITPYVVAEYGRYVDVGNKEERLLRYGRRLSDEYANGWMVRIGGGVKYHITPELFIDASLKGYHPDDDLESIEAMVGIGVQL